MSRTTFVLAGMAMGVALGACRAPLGKTSPQVDRFALQWESRANGGVESSLLPIRIDPSSYCADLLAASGNDVAPQPLSLYANQRRWGRVAPFMKSFSNPSWYSRENGYHMGLAAGRIDDDPFTDVAVSVLAEFPAREVADQAQERFFLGGVRIFRGLDCSKDRKADGCWNTPEAHLGVGSLETRAASQLDLKAGVVSVALGDANGDGRLDLATAIYTATDAGIVPAVDFARGKFPNGDARIYYNDGGQFRADKYWSPELPADIRYHAASVQFADINQDGTIDLVVGADRPYVYYGRASEAGITIDRNPGWVGDALDLGIANDWRTLMGLDVAWMSSEESTAGAPPVIAVGLGCPLLTNLEKRKACGGKFLLYQPGDGGRTAPIWSSTWSGSAAHVGLADIDADGRTDLIGTALWEAPTPDEGAGLRVLRGLKSDGAMFDEEYFVPRSSAGLVTEGLAVADFSGETLVDEWHKWLFDERMPSKRAYAIPGINVEGVIRVDRILANGERLPDEHWTSATMSRWLSIAEPLRVGEELRVHYLRSRAPDIAVATWNAERGILWYHNLDPTGIGTGKARCHEFKPTSKD